MTTTPEAASAPRTPRWLWIALILSLALNLLIIGMATAAMMHFRNTQGGPSARFAHYVRQLPKDRRDTLAAVLDQQRAELRPMRRKAREDFRRARRVFAAAPLDADRLAEASRAAAKSRADLVTARGEWFTKFATLLSDKERRDFLEWRQRSRHSRRRWHHRGRDHGPGASLRFPKD